MPAVEKPMPARHDAEFARLDRHIRTSLSLRELAHWNAERAGTRLSGAHDVALRKAIAARMKVLEGGAK
jgi:hypothetical protein